MGSSWWSGTRTAPYWICRYTINGRTREAGLGRARGHNAVSLADARERVRRLRDKVRDGKDPLAERQAEAVRSKAAAAKAAAGAITFSEVADKYIGAHEAGWRNAKHRQQWSNTLRDYVLPVIGEMAVADVDTGSVTQILGPLWKDKPETASRVRGRIESILDFAKTSGWRDGENPARWKGHLQNVLPAKTKVARVQHHAAVPWQEIGALMEKLRAVGSIAARCLEFTILTATRSGEARGARWSEIDLTSRIWTISAQRMKALQEHRIPLSDAAAAILEERARLRADASPDRLVFPGYRQGGQLSVSALWTAARDNGATVHGFRSTFRDWAGETTAYPREVIEMALAHRLGDKAEQAYARGDLFQKRRRLMADWADFCSRPLPAGAGNVVELRATA